MHYNIPKVQSEDIEEVVDILNRVVEELNLEEEEEEEEEYAPISLLDELDENARYTDIIDTVNRILTYLQEKEK